MDSDIYFHLRAFLRKSGESDLTKFSLHSDNGQVSISHWGYTITRPELATFERATASGIIREKEDMIENHVRDIYRGSGQAITRIISLNLTPVRRSCITTQGSNGYIRLQRGLYKFIVTGERENVGLGLDISIKTVTPDATVRSFAVRDLAFDFTAIRMLTEDTDLNIFIQKVIGTPNLNVEATLVIERL